MYDKPAALVTVANKRIGLKIAKDLPAPFKQNHELPRT